MEFHLPLSLTNDFGVWHLRDELAILVKPSHGAVSYTKEDLELTIQNVKNERCNYASEETYLKELKGFEVGLLVFETLGG